MLCLSSSRLRGLLRYTLSFRHPHKKVRRCEVGGSLGPEATPNNALTKKIPARKLLCLQHGVLPHLAATSNPFHSLRAKQWICVRRFWQRSALIKCLFKEQRSNDPFSGYRAPHTNLHRMQRTFNYCMWVFSTPKSTVLTLYVAVQMEPCFIAKKHIVQHINSFTHKKTEPVSILDYRTLITLLELMHWLESIRQ
jgi:hypothetical protein